MFNKACIRNVTIFMICIRNVRCMNHVVYEMSGTLRSCECECTFFVGLLAIVPPQGWESILIDILQSRRSTGGPHFT